MPGHGPAPKLNRQNKYDVPIRGEWQPAPGAGWQHGEIPAPPAGLLKKTREAWSAWFRGWWAAHWEVEMLPQVEATIRLYDAFYRGDYPRAGELRQWMDGIGVTPKGQKDNRWLKSDVKSQAEAKKAPALPRLRVINE